MTRRTFAELADGTKVETVTIGAGRLSADFLTLGARLNGLWFDGSGSLVPIHDLDAALGPDIVSGAVISPVMNRLSNARAPLDGRMLRFAPNEGPNLLHSGADGSAGRNWHIAETGPAHVAFDLDQPSGAFPGNRRTRAAYRITGDALHLEITVATDAPTLVNAGFHPYWTLTGRGRDGHLLTIHADRFLPSHPDNIPTGEVLPVTGTDRDYRRARQPAIDIDTCFPLGPGDRMRPAVRLMGGGIVLDVLTDAPACHVFTGHPSGIAVEPELWPDGPNQPGFPSFRLEAGATFRQRIEHRFSRP